MFWQRERHSTWKGLVAGAIGGAVASFAMNQSQAGMSKLFEQPKQPPNAKRKGRQAQGWKQHHPASRQEDAAEERANVKAAAAVSEAVFDHELAPEEKERAGEIVHYAYGTAAGALYGVAAEHWQDVRAGAGSAFGGVLWAISDEVAVPALRLSKGPQEYPLRVHAMGLAAHLVYGVTTELARRLLRSAVFSR
jgi:putative membrane protein